MKKYNYNIKIIDKYGNIHIVDTVAEMITEAILKALNKSKLANFEAKNIMIEYEGIYKMNRSEMEQIKEHRK